MKLACAYTRCSTNDQAESLPAQWEQIEAFAARNGYQIIERFEDDGVSGTSLNRRGLNTLTAHAQEAEWKFVLVWDRSRLGRPEDPREAIAVTYQIEQFGKTIIPLHGTQHTDNPVINTILEALEFGQAGEESIRKSRDVLRGQLKSARNGSIPNGKIPYGYDALYVMGSTPVKRVRYLADRSKQILSLDGSKVLENVSREQRVGKSGDETLVLIPGNPQKIEVVRRIFREYNSGLSTRAITYGLNRDGIPAPWGSVWGRTTVLRILDNPAYKGTLTWNRLTWAKFHNAESDGQILRISNPKKRLKANSPDKWVSLDRTWEGLVSREEWEQAKVRLKNSSKPAALRSKGATSSFLVSGLLKCTCGYHFAGSSCADSRRSGRRYEYYRCRSTTERGPAVCRAKRIPRHIIDGYLERRLRERYFEPAAKDIFWREIEGQLDQALTRLAQVDPLAEDRRRLTEVEGQIERLVDAIAQGVLTADEAENRLLPLRREKVALTAKFQAPDTGGLTGVNLPALRQKILQACRDQVLRETDLWPDSPPEIRKQIVRAHVASITADYAQSTIRTEFYPLIMTDGVGFNDTICS